jgi:protein-disulfide isomerase
MLRASFGILLTLTLAAGCRQYDPLSQSGGAGRATATPADIETRDPNAVVATIDGESLTEADLAEDLKPELISARNQYLEQMHGMREQGLDRLIDKRLIQRKAKAAGLTEEKYVEQEVFAKIGDPTDEEARALYDRVAASGRPLPPFEEVVNEVKAAAKEQKTMTALESFQQQLRAEAKIEKMLPPLLLPKVELGEVTGPIKGDPKAAVTIVEFSDYECGFCKRADPTVQEVLKAYPGKVRVVMQHFPLPSHPGAQKAAEAALCANEQGKHWEMHDKLFENNESLAPDDLKRYASELGLDAAKFTACLDGGTMEKALKDSVEMGRGAGVGSTPMFFVNGRPLSGAQPFDAFKALIELELGNKG